MPSPLQLDVLSVGFTPVKGTRHLVQPAARFDAHGPVGDRELCLVDVQRRRVLRTVRNPSLVCVVARWEDDGTLHVTLPDGRSVGGVPEPTGQRFVCDYWGRPVPLDVLGGGHAELFSSHLGREVVLARAPRGGVVYGAPLTVVATASVQELGARAGVPELLAEASRFRATLLVRTDVPFIEETWEGDVVEAAGMRLRVGAPVGRCAVIDIDPVTGARGTRLLRTLSRSRPRSAAGEPVFGMAAHPIV